jgi:hypothetical protein
MPRLRPYPRRRAFPRWFPGRVAVEGHAYAGVPQKVLDQLGVDAASQKEGGASMPKFVPADRGEARVLAGAREPEPIVLTNS